MSSPTEWPTRMLVARLVAMIAGQTGHTTIARFGEQDAPVPLVLTEKIEPRSPYDVVNVDYGALLRAAASRERQQPSHLRPIAAALVLPERDIAYLRFVDAPMTVLHVGRNHYDEPAARNPVADGLDALLQALQDNQPQPRPTGRGFPADPHRAATDPPPSPPLPPDHGPGQRPGPHR